MRKEQDKELEIIKTVITFPSINTQCHPPSAYLLLLMLGADATLLAYII
jgi:hypothetical protein